MTAFLDRACAAARERVVNAVASRPTAAVREGALATPTPPSFAAALGGPGVAVIAEVKRSSPSRGLLAPIPDPAGLALAYATGGAAAVSVLTEPQWFSGSLDDLAAVAATAGIPALRKDFIVDAHQLWEAREAGAAAALLIVAALPDPALAELLAVADAAGLDTLVEVHDADEVARAIAAAAAAATGRRLVIGVNARDLTTLEVDPGRFAALRAALQDAPAHPAQAFTVAESGVRDAGDVTRFAALGADAVLVGEHLATAPDPRAAVADLVGAGRPRD